MTAERTYAARNYDPLPVVLSHGEGAWITDVDGRRYLDLMSAYSAVSFGYAHPAILNALGANDFAAVGEQAHSLKGASANLRATAAAQAAARLEAAAKAGDAPQIDSAATELKTEVTRTIDYLRTKVAASA